MQKVIGILKRAEHGRRCGGALPELRVMQAGRGAARARQLPSHPPARRAGPAGCGEVRGRWHLLPAVGWWWRGGTSRLLGWELRVQGWVLASHEKVGYDESNHRQKGGGEGGEKKAQKENQPSPPKKSWESLQKN